MPARRDLERALGALLAADVPEVERRLVAGADFRLRAQQHLRALDVVGELEERAGGDDLHAGARPGGCGRAGAGTDRALAGGLGAVGGGRQAGDGGVDSSAPLGGTAATGRPAKRYWLQRACASPIAAARASLHRRGLRIISIDQWLAVFADLSRPGQHS